MYLCIEENSLPKDVKRKQKLWEVHNVNRLFHFLQFWIMKFMQQWVLCSSESYAAVSLMQQWVSESYQSCHWTWWARKWHCPDYVTLRSDRNQYRDPPLQDSDPPPHSEPEVYTCTFFIYFFFHKCMTLYNTWIIYFWHWKQRPQRVYCQNGDI